MDLTTYLIESYNHITSNLIKSSILFCICAAFIFLFHELGHHFWNIWIHKVPSKIWTSKNGFKTERTLPIERYSDLRNNPEKYYKLIKMGNYAGHLQLIPILVFIAFCSNYSLIFLTLGLAFSVYSFKEGRSYDYRKDDWFIEAFKGFENQFPDLNSKVKNID